MTREQIIAGLEQSVDFSAVEQSMTIVEQGVVRGALELLKAQEPVEPIENAGFYYCGACRYVFTSARQKYCSECGRAVKWDD